MKKTKIICSIGPSSSQPDVMEKMVLAGMNVARVNFTHATEEERKQVCDSVREVRKRTGKNIALLWDTKGPEFRSGMLEDDSIELVNGKTIRIVKEEVLGNEERFSVNHPEAIDSLDIGSIILLENAKMKLEVIDKDDEGVTCKIVAGGILGNRKSMSVPGVKLNIPYVSDADREDLDYACSHGGEFLAISFVSTKEDVLEIKEILREHDRLDLKIICKIESELGIKNLEEILEVSDGVMVARGDLGVEIPFGEVPIWQKKIINLANSMGKIAITATQMLESMTKSPVPSRAEASDVANAVFDGTDLVMMSAETASGDYPVESVKAMVSIATAAENSMIRQKTFDEIHYNEKGVNIPLADSASYLSHCLNHKAIIVLSKTGRTVLSLSKKRPKTPILFVSANKDLCNKLAICNNVHTIHVEKDLNFDGCEDTAIQIKALQEILIKRGFVNSGDVAMLVSGDKWEGLWQENSIRIVKIN